MTGTPFADLARRDEQTCTITIDGASYRLAPSSPHLLDALTSPDPLAVFPGLGDVHARQLIWHARHRDNPLTLPVLRRAAVDATAQLLGIPWQAGWQLASCLQAFWLPLHAKLARLSIDPVTSPAHRTLSAVYGILTHGISNADATKLDDQLWAWPDHLDLGDHTPETSHRYIRTVSGARKLVRPSRVMRPT